MRLRQKYKGKLLCVQCGSNTDLVSVDVEHYDEQGRITMEYTEIQCSECWCQDEEEN